MSGGGYVVEWSEAAIEDLLTKVKYHWVADELMKVAKPRSTNTTPPTGDTIRHCTGAAASPCNSETCSTTPRHGARTGITTSNPGSTCSTTDANQRSPYDTATSSSPSDTTKNSSPPSWIYDPPQTPPRPDKRRRRIRLAVATTTPHLLAGSNRCFRRPVGCYLSRSNQVI